MRSIPSNRPDRRALVRSFASAALLALPVSLLVGCGSGGGVRTISSNSGRPATQMLAPQIGQTWTYTSMGVVDFSGATTTYIGPLTNTIASTTVAGADMAQVTTSDVTNNGSPLPLNTVTNIKVESDGTVNTVALQDPLGGTVHPLATPLLFLPAQLSATTSYSGNTTLTDTNTPYSESFAVVGSETVTVPAGTFNTWKVTGTIQQGAFVETITEWIAPEIGAAVKETDIYADSTDPNSSITLTKTLSSTNVVH